MRSKLLAILMSLAMVFTIMPIMGAPVYAEPAGDPAINLVENGSAPNITGAQTSSIWFGDYKQSPDGSGDHNKEPIKWRVLSNENGELFLLSDQNLDCNKYNDTYVDVTWETSGIRTWLNGDFMSTAFSSGEQSAIKTTDVVNDNNPEYNTPGGENTQDQIFLLSIEEATNEKYGFRNNYNDTPTREAKNTAYATWRGAWTSDAGNGYWWLRSPGFGGTFVAVVPNAGYLNSAGGSVAYGGGAVRPALNMNLSSVIFTSAADRGKSSEGVGAGALKPVGSNSTNDWKLTVQSGHDSFAVEAVSMPCNSKEVSVTYSGAITGDWEYISAIIKDKDGKVKYYGNLKKCTTEGDASGTVKINVDGKLGAEDTLCVFNEQLNGDKKTDFSSELKEIAIPQPGHDWYQDKDHTTFEYYNQTVGDGGKMKCKATLTCKRDSSHTQEVYSNASIGYHDKFPTCEDPGSDVMDYSFPDPYRWLTPLAKVTTSVPPKGHKYGAWTKLNATQHQKLCQHNTSHVVKENHKWDAGKVTKKPTEKQAGIKTYTCTVCKATKTATIPKLKPSAPKISGTPLARMTATGKTSLTINWNRILGAAGYDIFFAQCDHDNRKSATRNVKAIKGNKTFKWTKSGLKEGTGYKAYVRAYIYKNGKKTYVRNTPLVHAYTGNGNTNYTNAGSVTLNKTNVTLKKGKTFKITAKVNKVNNKKKLMSKSHAQEIRYATSNSKIAVVDGSGKITAKGKGTCYIYAYAHNGVSKQVKVTVK